MIVALDQLCTCVWGCVSGLDVTAQLRQRLRDFGLVDGTWVRCRYRSPAGDVIAVELRGSVLALRKQDAHRIWVRV